MRLQSLGLVALLLTASCFGTPPPPDDAGDAQWVMDVLPTLLGRPAKSTLELQALVDIVGAEGRGAVVDLLTSRPEFARYWALVLLEDMQIDTGGVHAIDTDCLVERDPLWQGLGVDYIYTDDYYAGMTTLEADDILSHVGPGLARVNSPGIDNSFGKLVEAAVHNDRLDLAFAAHMPVLASTHTENNKENLRKRFLDRVLNRNLDCVACHNGEWSTTDDPLQVQQLAGGWDRTWPHSEVVLEGSLFDYADGYGGIANGAYAGGAVKTNVNNLFGIEQWGSVTDGSFNGVAGGTDTIYGLKPACVTRSDGTTSQQLMVSAVPADVSKFAGMSGHKSVLDVADTFLGDSQQLGSGFFHPQPNLVPRATHPMPFALVYQQQSGHYTGSACINCHSVGGQLDPGFADIPDWRIYQVLLESWPTDMNSANCGSAPTTALSNPDLCAREAIRTVRAAVPYRQKEEYDTPERALGMAVAMQVADHIAEELSGSRITLQHGMARSLDGADLQRELAYRLVENGWSLRAVLKHVVLSDGFNRRAPSETGALTPEDHYVLAQVAKPFAQLRPGLSAAPQDNFASLGDSVHRHSAVHLVEKVHHALGWPSSWSPGQSGIYPDPDYLNGLGQFKSGDEPGFNEPILPAQLVWEAQMGSCTLSTAAVRSPQTEQVGPNNISNPGDWDDWIDILIDDAVAGDWPIEQVIQLTRERLLQDPKIDPAEAFALEALAYENQVSLGVAYVNLDDPQPVMYPFTAGAVDPGDLEDLVRQYCGALVTSPQFMMGGISTADATEAITIGQQLPPRPAFKIPGPIRPGADPQEPLSHSDWCDAYGYALDVNGLCTEPVTQLNSGGVDGLLAGSGSASDYLRRDVAGEILVAAERAPLEALPDLESAIEEVVGANPGVSVDGAADKLEGGQYTSAMTKLGKAAEDLLDAEALGCDCDAALDTLVEGGFIAAEAILTTEKLAGANDRKLADASALLEAARQVQQGGPLVADDPYDREIPLDGYHDRNERPVDTDVPVAVETFALLKEAVQGL